MFYTMCGLRPRALNNPAVNSQSPCDVLENRMDVIRDMHQLTRPPQTSRQTKEVTQKVMEGAEV